MGITHPCDLKRLKLTAACRCCGTPTRPARWQLLGGMASSSSGIEKSDSQIHWKKFCERRAFCWTLTVSARVVSICRVMSTDFNSEYVSLFNHRGIGLDIVEVLHCSTFTVTLTAESTCVLKCDSIISEITGLHTGKKGHNGSQGHRSSDSQGKCFIILQMLLLWSHNRKDVDLADESEFEY